MSIVPIPVYVTVKTFNDVTNEHDLVGEFAFESTLAFYEQHSRNYELESLQQYDWCRVSDVSKFRKEGCYRYLVTYFHEVSEEES